MAANVAVRFSVEDQEVVRKALNDLGEQGKAALKKMDDTAKPSSSSMKAVSNVVDEVKGRMTGLAGSLGPVGSGLIALGPLGIAAGAAIGAAVLAFGKLNEMANELATKSSRLSNFAELTGLSTDQVQALDNVTVKYGKSAEDTNNVIERAAQAWDQLRRGQGEAFDQIRKIDPALLNQLAGAKDLAAALDILATAYDKAGDEAAKIALAKAFGGKGGVSTLGALLGGINESGGIASLTKDAKDAGSVIDKDLIQRLSTLQAQIKDIKERTGDKFAALFSENTLQHNKEMAEDVERIVNGIRWLKENANDTSIFKAITDFARGNNPFAAAQPAPGVGRGSRSGREGDLDSVPAPEPTVGAVPAPAGAIPLAVQLREMRDWVGLLGSAATSAEQYNLKELELKKAVDDRSISQEKATRALAAFKLAQDQATEGMRERLGIATEDNIVSSRMAQLRDAQAKGIIRSDEEFSRAEQLVQREARQTAEAMEVRNSSFKGLKQLEIDGRDLSKSLDTGLTSSLGNLSGGLADILDRTKTAGVGFADLEKMVIRSLLEMSIKMAIVAPIARGFLALLSGIPGLGSLGIGAGGGQITLGTAGGPTPFPSANGNVFSGGNIIPFRAGGVIRRQVMFPMANGGTGIAGEGDKEEGILPLTRINGKLGVYATGGASSSAQPPGVELHVHGVENPKQVRVQQSVDGRGNQRLDVMLDGAVSAALSRPGSNTRRSLGANFGAKPVGVRR